MIHLSNLWYLAFYVAKLLNAIVCYSVFDFGYINDSVSSLIIVFHGDR